MNNVGQRRRRGSPVDWWEEIMKLRKEKLKILLRDKTMDAYNDYRNIKKEARQVIRRKKNENFKECGKHK